MEQILLNETIEIPKVPEGPGEDGNGVHSFIYRGDQVREIEKKFGRENCCIKIFKNNEHFREDGWWGPSSRAKGSLLKEAIHIQNIYALEGLAPRVYAQFVLVVNGDKHWAYLTDDLGHCIPDAQRQAELMEGELKEVGDKYGIEVFNDGREWNVVAGKYVDFQGFHLKEDYKERLKKRLHGVANVGKWGPWENYHDIPELDIKGGRNNERRIKEMHLDEIDFEGKTVLDVGCSEGFFCRYAIDRGARMVTGIDLPGVVEPTAELSYYLGYNNIDYLGADLLRDTPKIGNFDIVFFFSMVQHIGFPEWLRPATIELLVSEGNGKANDIAAESGIQQQFASYEKIGETKDLFTRPVIWAKP